MIKLTRPPCPEPRHLALWNYKHPINKAALSASTFGKCMYCESRVCHIDYGDVEHYKPKAVGKYPNLEFEWSNLGYACGKCNSNKSDKFDESCPYINPYEDNPGDYITFLGWFAIHKKGSERGQLTVYDIKLNRPGLIEKRKVRIEAITSAIDACFRTKNESIRERALALIRDECDNDKEFSLAVKMAVVAHGITGL